jgi:hypothetical protein
MMTRDPSPAHARLNVDGLSNVDAMRVQAFLPYCRGRTRYDWQLAQTGDTGHALFVDADEPGTISGGDRIEGGIVRVRRRDAAQAPPGDHMMLVSPLQLEDFIAMLRCIETRLVRPAAGAQPEGRARVPADPVAAAVSPAMAYRLRRWPPAGVLARHRYNARLASFLSTRHLTAGQLGLLSNVDAVHCMEFMSDLLAIDLLDAAVPPAGGRRALARPAAPGAAAEAGTALRTHSSAGLLDRIRRRLGID